MNDIEFAEVQNEMGNRIVEFERFSKKGFLLEAEYVYHFHEWIEKEFKVTQENEFLKNIIQYNAEQKNIDEFISTFKKSYSQRIVDFSRRYDRFARICEAKKNTSVEMLEELETEFKEFALKYHPAIKWKVSPQEGQAYMMAKQLYFENNYSGFLEFLKLNPLLTKEVKFTSEQFTQVNEYYFLLMQDIQKSISQKKKMFPYTIEEVMEDDISIAREVAEFKVRINQEYGKNKALHKDVIEALGKNYSLE